MATSSLLVSEGKTKVVLPVEGDPMSCILRAKTAITAHDDPSLTQQIDSKPLDATATTCRVFELLRDAGLPVAYDRQISPTEFMAPLCTMVPLECIARRYAVGSYRKRFPQTPDGHRFHRLVMEFFLKTTGGNVRQMNGEVMELGLTVEDPLILTPKEGLWQLSHPKYPTWESQALIKRQIASNLLVTQAVDMNLIEDLTRKAFLVLEKAWGMQGCKLYDFKIEFGVDGRGNLLIADVIDNDSWRLRTADGKEVSKQLFREGHPLAEVEQAYHVVAGLVQRFRLPKQALVFWRGSKDDEFPEAIAKLNVPGVTVVDIPASAHKATHGALAKLEQTLTQYPEGGVIIASAGRSNGLGPVLAAHTMWPVVSVCPTMKEFPLDVWSSLRTPSDDPLCIVPEAGNALLAALNILGLSNPAAYAARQFRIENLDPTY